MRELTAVDDIDDGETIERRGASGARIIIGRKFTTKLDVERTGTFVRDQGEWLTKFPQVTMLPRVQHILAHGYVMETLSVPTLPDDTLHLVGHVMAELRTQLWSKPSSGLPFDWQTHRSYVSNLLKDVQPDRASRSELDHVMRKFASRVDFDSLQRGQTHGDCIVDNVAYRAREGSTTGQLDLVVLDPIPASYALPPLRAVDVGRLIQSAIGYESVRYTRSRSHLLTTDGNSMNVLNWYMPEGFRVNEARACLYFAIIHMLRGVRTTTPETATRFALWFLTNELIEVTREWMR